MNIKKIKREHGWAETREVLTNKMFKAPEGA